MNITYNKKIKSFEEKTKFPHCALSEEIKTYIGKKELQQKYYLSSRYGAYFFLYFNNGDRIDILY